ncbi:MAG: hypothetical protein LBT54_01690 [Bifidobacteriaceae bacterium]|jgi:hypothetical protein|nr:hypothetical protein [Bifidobacteriaceae bacterium]
MAGRTAVADGREHFPARVTPRGANGNAVGGHPVAFTVPAGVSAGTDNGPATVTRSLDAQGVAASATTPSTPGSCGVTATAGGRYITTGPPGIVGFVLG